MNLLRNIGRYTERALAALTQANTLVGLPGGTAAYAAMVKAVGVNSMLIQPVILAHPSGHLFGTKPAFLVWTQLTTLAPANRVPWAFYNSSASGITAELEAIIFQKNRRAVTGLNFDLALSRITSLGPAGTGLGSAGGAKQTTFALDPTNIVPSSTWLTWCPSTNIIGGISSLMTRYYHSEETDTAAAEQEVYPFYPIPGMPLLTLQNMQCPPGYGYMVSHAASAAGEYIHGLIFSIFSGP